MTAKLEQLEGLQRQLAVTVLADDVKKKYQKKLADVARKANIKGFRPGKVPVSIVEQKFGQGLLHEAAAELIDSTFQQQIIEQKIKIAGAPQVDFDYENLKRDAAFDYVAKFEVYPEVSLKDLTDVEVDSFSGEVSDDDVNAMLIQLRTQHAEWQAVDRAAKLGDRIQIDFDGVIDGKPLEQGSAKGHSLELGSNSMIPGFEEGLIGAKKGETKTINVTFPTEYHVEALRSKPVVFTIVVHDIQEPKLPALDDDFAKKIGVAEGLDALKKQVKEKMQAELNDTAHAQTKSAVLDKLMSLNEIEVPTALLDAEITHLQNMARQQIAQYRRDLSESDIKNFPLTREPFEADAKKRVVLGLLLAEVIKAHDIKVDQDKVSDRLKQMASQYGDPAQILPIILKNKQMVTDVEAFVLEDQAIQALLTKARVLPVKKSYDAIMNTKERA
ncbi:MAG: trigger factor [Gammaproteobacteria bacterium CG_4_10_14_0_8_um_filter_38_16]|nr:MAG: trigger factor [Gammaproteobacteria bacterium CG_4_10_14_0_8_um_filter_38_16]PJA03486.1 MAG: trigger factor [Gammaproteobacteria bacterium CG_4_10_14_0_2_um_filter_38_22]PJB10641.1 MAG: trigger factor [Gammaproteobacteria bacterium CG_4_9_14_3_um_filter_38_9]